MSVDIPWAVSDVLRWVITPTITPEQREAARQEIHTRTEIPLDQIDDTMIESYLRLSEDIRGRLDLLAVTSATTVEGRIQALHAILERHSNENTPDIQLQLTAQAEEAARRAAEVASEQATTYVRDQVTSWINSWYERIIPESIRNFFWEGFNLWQSLWSWFTGLFAGTWFGRRLLWNNSETPEPVETVTPEPEATPEQEPDPATEVVREDFSSERRRLTIAWYHILHQLSGLSLTRDVNSPIIAVYNDILSNHTLSHIETLIQGNNISTLTEGTNYSEEIIHQAMLGFIWPINRSLLESRLTEVKMKTILWYNEENWEFSDIARRYFSEEELSIIQNNAFNFSEIPLNILSRLLALSFRNIFMTASQEVATGWMSIWTLIGTTLLSWGIYHDLQQVFWETERNDIYPEGMEQALLPYITEGWDALSLPLEAIVEINNPDIPETDRNHLRDFLSFRDSLIPYLSQENFGLWIEWFEESLGNRLTYGRILALYIALNGINSTNTLWNHDRSIIYIWIYNILEWDIKGRYQTQIITQALTRISEWDEDPVLNAVVFRISEMDRNTTLSWIERVIWWVDQAVENQVRTLLPEFFEQNPQLLRIATWAVEIGWVALLLKILFRMPVMRAVLIATSWIIPLTLYFGLKESVYSSLDSDIQNLYNNYLNTLITNVEGIPSEYRTIEALRSAINNNTISLQVVQSWFEDADISTIVWDFFAENT